jgi:hypothetical protein
MAKAKANVKLSADDQLTEHMKQAENHLIAAVELFTSDPKLTRRVGYFTRLVNAQESITGLVREELIRERGPLRPRRRSR